jgi:secondary thiamine-phosphate synthase enzyme
MALIIASNDVIYHATRDAAGKAAERCQGSGRPLLKSEKWRTPGVYNTASVFKIETMKFHTEYLTLHTKTKRAYIHLTPQVESALKKSGIKDGMILVSAMHITAGVYVNDNESGLIKDIDAWLETLAPFRQNYQHHQTGEDNGDAHLKSLIIHHEVIVPVTNGKLDFGPWQQIFYAEFDGQRDKRVIIKVMGE